MGLPLRSFGWLPVTFDVDSWIVVVVVAVVAPSVPAFAATALISARISTGRLTSAGEGAALAAAVGIEGDAMGDMR
jgi:hypothetical protein